MRTLIATLAVLAVVSAACGSDDAATSSTPGTGTDPATASPDDGGTVDAWPTAGQDLANSRTAVASGIDRSTVDDLDEAWSAPLDAIGTLSTVPIVIGDTVYLQGGTGQVVAVDRAEGSVRWASEPTGFNIGPFGVAVDGGRVFAMDGSSGIVALDEADGSELWTQDVTATDTTGVDIQPIVVDDIVIVSSVPVSIDGIYTPGDRGVVTALDAATGEARWTFDTVKGDLWGNPEVNSGGGAWYPPAVDTERGLVYVGTANPAPFPGTEEWPNATSRPGDNLYTNSVVALDLETGELAWFHQVVPHDLFDRDQIHTLIADVEGGPAGTTEVVVSAGKSGIVVGLDPDEGTVLWEVEVGEHDNDDLEELDGPTTVAPGTFGGVLTPPSTADGVVYLASVNAPVELKPDETAYFGAAMGAADGSVAAVDAGTGEVLWEVDVPGDPLGGTAVVNDLVFTALLDGTVVALDREGGEMVWSHEASGGINGWMSVAGDEIFVPIGNAAPPELLALHLP